MHPVLIQLGPFSIYAFGFMLALSFLLGIALGRDRERRQEQGHEQMVQVVQVESSHATQPIALGICHRQDSKRTAAGSMGCRRRLLPSVRDPLLHAV